MHQTEVGNAKANGMLLQAKIRKISYLCCLAVVKSNEMAEKTKKTEMEASCSGADPCMLYLHMVTY